MQLTITWTNHNPNTIYNRLAARLGREPTRAEIVADLDRIRGEALAEIAEQGKLSSQRGRAA